MSKFLSMEAFSIGLDLGGANSTTTLVLTSMIIFLLVLIFVIGFSFINQRKSRVKSQSTMVKKKEAKGF